MQAAVFCANEIDGLTGRNTIPNISSKKRIFLSKLIRVIESHRLLHWAKMLTSLDIMSFSYLRGYANDIIVLMVVNLRGVF